MSQASSGMINGNRGGWDRWLEIENKIREWEDTNPINPRWKCEHQNNRQLWVQVLSQRLVAGGGCCGIEWWQQVMSWMFGFLLPTRKIQWSSGLWHHAGPFPSIMPFREQINRCMEDLYSFFSVGLILKWLNAILKNKEASGGQPNPGTGDKLSCLLVLSHERSQHWVPPHPFPSYSTNIKTDDFSWNQLLLVLSQ